MRIQLHSRQTASIESKSVLQPGQIVQGNIMKLFPNERAQIQLGSQQLIAQLQAALAVGKSYHFQVQRVDEDVIHLKVLTEQVQGNPRENMMTLMRHFGVKPTNEQMNFIQSLINERIPFQPSEIVTAKNLLNTVKNQSKAQHVLKYMFQKQLPINEAIFQSLYINKTMNFSNVINAFTESIRPNDSVPLRFPLQQLLGEIQVSDSKVMRQALGRVVQTEPSFASLLQSIGIVTSEQLTELQNQTSELDQLAKLGQNMRQTQQTINQQSIQNIMQHLLDNQQVLMTEANKIVRDWAYIPIPNGQAKIPMTEYNNFKQMIHRQIVPLLTPNVQQHVLTMLQADQSQFEQLYELLTRLSTEKTYELASKLQTMIRYENPKQQFLTQLSNLLLGTGLSYEHILARDDEPTQLSTLKPMLLQYIGQHDGLSKDRAQQLIQFINGLQIQSVQESAHFVQAHITLPGEKLGLHDDIQLEFESKKTSDGEINPDYCRILFYLNLAKLEETVIDMNIQNRLVSLTIYNDRTPFIQTLADQFEPTLKEGLQSLDYDLTRMMFKQLKQENEQHTSDVTMRTNQQTPYEGIDFRI